MPPEIVATFAGLAIAVEPDFDVEPGRQWILIEARSDAIALLRALTGPDHHATPAGVAPGDWIRIPHTAEVDQRLKQLVDLAAAIRRAAPSLIQLSITGFDDHGNDHGHSNGHDPD